MQIAPGIRVRKARKKENEEEMKILYICAVPVYCIYVCLNDFCNNLLQSQYYACITVNSPRRKLR